MKITHNHYKMHLGTILRSILAEPEARRLELNSSQATRAHARLIQKKAFLRKLYERYYGEFAKSDRESPRGVRVEIGSGGGFLEKVIPGLVKVDIRPGAKVQLTASALELPFKDRCVGALFMLNTLHHLTDAARFFEELGRVLVPSGRAVFIEPFVSPFSRFVYGSLHHEPFDPKSPNWALPAGGPMGSSNQALPWIMFVRDRSGFEARFPALKIVEIAPHTVLAYLLSGGVSMRCFVPQALFAPIWGADRLLSRRFPGAATMMTAKVVFSGAAEHG